MLSERKNIIFFILLYIFLLNLVAHFIPFERSSISPDDYGFLYGFAGKFSGIDLFFQNPDRPLQFMWLNFQNIIIGEDAQKGLIGVFISSLLTIFSTYYLLRLFFNKEASFIIITIYSLFISKLEIFHTPIFIHINLISSIYIFSLINFIIYVKKNNYRNYVKKNNYRNYLISLLLYTLGIFWYEIGALLIFVFFIYFYLYNNRHTNFAKIIILLIPFSFILLFYLIYRFTGGFGVVDIFPGHQVNPFNFFQGLKDSFHHFFGRYLFKNIIYGVYLFFNIKPNWLILIIFLDILFFITLIIILKNFNLQNIKRKDFIIFFCIFVVTLIPNILSGSVGGRNLIISSISFSIFLYLLLTLFKKNWRKIFIFFSIFGIIICQGNAWAQVISCRINNSVYETLKENKVRILKSDLVVIDIKSFSENIYHTFLKQDFNFLNTYFSAQTFEVQGLVKMVNLTIKNSNKKIDTYIAIESPIITVNNETKFSYIKNQSYRNIISETIFLKNSKIFVVDYDLVYKNGFFYGQRYP